MTTRNLLGWIGLFGGAEAMLRGHLMALPWLFGGGAVLLLAALAFAAWRLRDRRGLAATLAALAIVHALWATLEAAGAFDSSAAAPDPLNELWTMRARERAVLDGGLRDTGRELVHLFGHPIALDPRGWRHSTATGGGFRIVATGGASTFGATRTPDEPTWPSALAGLIEAELQCAVPIEVVNAGVPGRGIQGTLETLDADLAQLRPDLLLHLPEVEDLAAVVRSLPEITLPAREPVPPRASQLVRRLELGRRARTAAGTFAQAAAVDHSERDLRDTPLGRAYRALLLGARQQGVDVVLLPIVLAVGIESPEPELHRFEALEPRARRFALARPLHQRLLRQVAATHRAQVVDTTPDLDATGEAAFLHLATLAPEGRQRLARNVFEGLRPRLARDPSPGCTPNDAAR
jgi:hypothetical protein